jgi:hypothetical protein
LKTAPHLGHFTCASFEIPAQPAAKDASMIQANPMANSFLTIVALLPRLTILLPFD